MAMSITMNRNQENGKKKRKRKKETMDAASFPPITICSGFSPTGSLLESLLHLSNEVISMEKLPSVQLRNISSMIRRIKLVTCLFQDMRESSRTTPVVPLPPSCILCLTELFSVIQRLKLLIQRCKDGSFLWNLMQTESVSNQFHVLVKEMGRALDILPLSLLLLNLDTKEQVELLHRQAKRVDSCVDLQELRKKQELVQMMPCKNNKDIDLEKVKQVFSSIGLRCALDYQDEIVKLQAEAQKQAGTGGLIVVSNINSLISLLTYSKSVIFCGGGEEDEEEMKQNPNKQQSADTNSVFINQDVSSSLSVLQNVPDEFRCPISLDMMRDPVIVASGHTYDRNSIAQWINSGHHTCPKSGQRLIHMALIPNYSLKSLLHQWCMENNVPLLDTNSSSSSESDRSSSQSQSHETAIDHISATKTAADAVRMTAEFLVGKLAMGSTEIQRQAAYELRLLAKTGMDNRRTIAEAGAIPFLVTLLSSSDTRIQENAVTTLLNLSILGNNKILIMAAGAIDSIISVLESGKSMEARENAAATIFSLSVINDCKVTIGARPRAIPALVGLVREGTTAGKRDAASALFNLAVYNGNKASVVIAGAVPLLIELLMDDKAGITDDALAVLALLLGCSEGAEEMKKSSVLVPLLIDLLRFGSAKGKENSITLLLGLCKDGGKDVARHLLINPRSIPSLQCLSADGTLKARHKADTLLRLLNRCCSESQDPVGSNV